MKGKRRGPGPISVRGWIGIKSVCAVLVIITGDGILGVGCIVTIVVDSGEAHVAVPGFASQSGVYLYRVHVADPVTGASQGTLSGKMMILK